MSVTAVHHGMHLQLDELDAENAEYFRHCASGQLHLQSCQACHLMRYPPTTACPWCAGRESTWRKVSGKGTVYSFSEVVHAIQPGLKAHAPYGVVLVELDEQKDLPGPGYALRIIGNILEQDGRFAVPASLARVGIGSRVEICFSVLAEGLSLPQWTLSSDAAEACGWRPGSVDGSRLAGC